VTSSQRAPKIHEGWLAGNVDKVETVEFEAAVAEEYGNAWAIESIPDDGMLLCGHPGSGNVIAVAAFGKKHLGDKYKFQMCDIMKGEQMSPDFVGMNPFHQVPSAKLADGTCLYESGAMLRYLANKFAPETYPDDAKQRLRIDMCMDKRQIDLYKAWAPIGYYAMGLKPAPAKDAAKKLNSVLATMKEAFVTGKFIGGDKLCIADYSVFPLIYTLTLPVVAKVGFTLHDDMKKYVEDVKAELGEDIFTEVTAVHTGWLGSRVDETGTVEFEA